MNELSIYEPIPIRELTLESGRDIPYVVADFETNEGAVNGKLTDVFCLVIYVPHINDSFVYYPDDFKNPGTIAEIQEWFEDYTVIFHNAAFDLWVASQLGLRVRSFECTYVMSYCISPSMPHGLGALATHLGLEHKKMEFDDFTQLTEEMVDYCINDCKVTWDVFQKFTSFEPDLSIYYDVELPFILVLMELNHTGIYVDRENWEKVIEEVTQKRSEALDKIWGIAPLAPGKSYKTKRLRPDDTVCNTKKLKDGKFYYVGQDDNEMYVYKKIETFNPNSSDQIAFMLNHLYGWEPTETTDSGKPKVDRETLKEVPYELADYLLEYSKVNKIVTTYGDDLLAKVKDDGRLYGSFNQCVTLTGRLSSSQPNLQNIPSKGDVGDAIRKLFIASPHHKLLGCDVDSFQVRILAYYLNTYFGEEYDDANALFKEFCENPDADPHQVNADVIGCERKVAKNCLFGDIFGFGAEKFARMSGLDLWEAQAILKQQRDRYPSISLLKEKVWQLGEENEGIVYDLYGRRGVYPDLCSTNKSKKARAQRQAFNFIIQSTEASIIKLWLISIRDTLQYLKLDSVRIALQVHDEILLEFPSELDEEMLQYIVQDNLQCNNWLGRTLPVTGTPEIGDSWYSCHG